VSDDCDESKLFAESSIIANVIVNVAMPGCMAMVMTAAHDYQRGSGAQSAARAGVGVTRTALPTAPPTTCSHRRGRLAAPALRASTLAGARLLPHGRVMGAYLRSMPPRPVLTTSMKGVWVEREAATVATRPSMARRPLAISAAGVSPALPKMGTMTP